MIYTDHSFVGPVISCYDINFLAVLLKKSIPFRVIYNLKKQSEFRHPLVSEDLKPTTFCCSYLLMTECQRYNSWQKVPLVS